MKKTLLAKCLCALLTISAASCSDKADDPEFCSQPPLFSEMPISVLGGAPANVFPAGSTLVATAMQSRKGRLLYKADYKWKCEPANAAQEPVDVRHRNKSAVVYDKDNGNPTDTLTISKPGIYRLTFTGRYHISGSNCETVNGTAEIPQGKVTYSTPSFLYYDITMERTLRVN